MCSDFETGFLFLLERPAHSITAIAIDLSRPVMLHTHAREDYTEAEMTKLQWHVMLTDLTCNHDVWSSFCPYLYLGMPHHLQNDNLQLLLV